MKKDFYCDEILNGKIPVKIVHETKNILAFYHTKPSYPLHIIVIPKVHIPDLITCIEDHKSIIDEMMNVLKIVIKKTIREHKKCRLTTNFGQYQHTKHLHWHIYIDNKMMEQDKSYV